MARVTLTNGLVFALACRAVSACHGPAAVTSLGEPTAPSRAAPGTATPTASSAITPPPTTTEATHAQTPPPSSALAFAADSCPTGMVSLPPPAANGRDPVARKRRLCFDRTEVTVADYAACVERGRCDPPLSYDPKFEDDLYRAFCNWQSPDARDQHPVNCVTFEQAQLYCESSGARLPTDVEWRWVASNRARTRYPWGVVAPDGERVNGCGLECPAAVKAATGNPEMRATYAQNDGYAATAPVGSFVKGDTASGIRSRGQRLGVRRCRRVPRVQRRSHGRWKLVKSGSQADGCGSVHSHGLGARHQPITGVSLRQ